MKKKLWYVFVLFAFGALYADPNSPPKQTSATKKENKQANKKENQGPLVLELSLDKAIQLVLHNNLTLRSAKFDVLMSDTDYRMYLQKYSLRINADGSYMYQKNPVSGMTSAFGGDITTQSSFNISVSKIFSTGTLLSAGISESLFDQNDKAIFGIKAKEDPAYHKPSLFLSVQQELLKNFIGVNDRRNLKALKTMTEMKKEAYIFQLSGLIVSTLIDYWQVIIEEYAVKNAGKAYDSTVQIRDIIARNAAYGLTDSFEVNQYQALVAAAQSRRQLTEFQKDQAMRKLLRSINMPPDTKIKGITELTEKLPAMDLEESIKTAFENRVDYKNALREKEVNELNLAIAQNNALPSITAFLSLTTMGQSDVFSTAFADSLSTKFPTWNAGFRISYPLFDEGLKTAVRNADFRLEQSKIKLEQLTKEIKDEVTEKYEAVKLQYNVMINTKTVMKESQLYYDKIMQNAQRGRLSSIVVKNALDSIIDARQKTLEAIVQYNIALLQFDLAKNEIFKKYNIDILELLKNLDQ